MNNPQESLDRSKSNDYRTIEQTMEKLSGGTRRLAAQLTTSASFDSLWNVLTDYDRLNLYIPNLLSSKKIYQKDNNVKLKQVGAQDFLGIKFSAEVTIDLFEDKEIGLLKFNLIKGDFRKFALQLNKKLRVRLAFRQVLLLFILSLPHRDSKMKAGTDPNFRYNPSSSSMDLHDSPAY